MANLSSPLKKFKALTENFKTKAPWRKPLRIIGKKNQASGGNIDRVKWFLLEALQNAFSTTPLTGCLTILELPN